MVSSERGPCDLQPWRSGSRSSQAEHAVCELPAGRVREHHLSPFAPLSRLTVLRPPQYNKTSYTAVLFEPVVQYHLISCSGFSLQHHWHVWRIHSQPAVLSDDLRTKLSLLQSSHWTQDRNRLLFCRRVCTWLRNNNRTPALHWAAVSYSLILLVWLGS